MSQVIQIKSVVFDSGTATISTGVDGTIEVTVVVDGIQFLIPYKLIDLGLTAAQITQIQSLFNAIRSRALAKVTSSMQVLP